MSQSESALFDQAAHILNQFQIEIPSWGFANTGTRFGKFVQPLPHPLSRRNSPTPPKSTASLALRRRLRCTSCGTCHADSPTSERCRSSNVAPGFVRFDQSQSLSGSAIQVWLPLQSFQLRSEKTRSSTFSIRSKSPSVSVRAIFRCGSPTARTIPARSPSATASSGWKTPSLAAHEHLAPRSATARRIQAL